ncbi:hypothetical protein MN608_02195 [Microdochium nivale]|nr:hypothetical protein MN608_02195 [Microdochium nivale]
MAVHMLHTFGAFPPPTRQALHQILACDRSTASWVKPCCVSLCHHFHKSWHFGETVLGHYESLSPIRLRQ